MIESDIITVSAQTIFFGKLYLANTFSLYPTLPTSLCRFFFSCFSALQAHSSTPLNVTAVLHFYFITPVRFLPSCSRHSIPRRRSSRLVAHICLYTYHIHPTFKSLISLIINHAFLQVSPRPCLRCIYCDPYSGHRSRHPIFDTLCGILYLG